MFIVGPRTVYPKDIVFSEFYTPDNLMDLSFYAPVYAYTNPCDVMTGIKPMLLRYGTQKFGRIQQFIFSG